MHDQHIPTDASAITLETVFKEFLSAVRASPNLVDVNIAAGIASNKLAGISEDPA